MPRVYQPKPCRRCGGEKPKAGGWYCVPCGDVARKEWAAIRQPWRCGKCDNPWLCLMCKKNKHTVMREAAARGAATRRANNPTWARPVDASRYWQRKAHAMVKQAVNAGLLPNLKRGEYACADCNGVAMEYDHRDYGRPLDVVPVCVCCNKRRGTAIWPSAERYQFARITREKAAA